MDTSSSSTEAGSSSPAVQSVEHRPVVRGKAFFVDDRKFIVRGVTYGPFRPDGSGCTYHDSATVARDFAAMARFGINSLRTYTCPPRWLLDVAAEQGLRVLVGVGLAGEQQSAFLDDAKLLRSVRQRCAKAVRACSGHPAVLAYAVGNEIPSTIVRWHGRRPIERFVSALCEVVREHDNHGLVTYVNYPTTEYLQLPFLDFLSYNVYLEETQQFDLYLARLQNLADYKPLVMAEIGLDSLRKGEEAQSSTLKWQIRSSFAAGCAGVFVFSWTDEWHTGGADVADWRFGLTDHARRPKRALAAVQTAFEQVPLPVPSTVEDSLPRISVAVCTYNGSRTLADCLEGCSKLTYPDYEVIVINDGSTDASAELARQFNARLINTCNRGLSRARNLGLRAATGQVIAYLDDDARPDEHWLHYIAHAFATTNHVGIGGPNIVPVDDPPFAQCVANSPGGPTHVLITDQLAEHIPGCNMAFRVDQLREVGGFDDQFRIAGDDVDVCWKLQAKGWTLGFHPAAIVWHHRRTSLKAYWKQQLNYGRAEAMLEVKWPEKYNTIGHVGWKGRLYGTGSCRGVSWLRSRVYHGTWATAAFQPLCERDSLASALPLMPEWYLVIAILALLSIAGLLWPPLLICVPLTVLAAATTVVQAARSAASATYLKPRLRLERLKLYAITTMLHVLQPAARLWGRLSYGLTPWRRRHTPRTFMVPRARSMTIWAEQWQPAEQRLGAIEAMLRTRRAPIRRGGAFDRWDLEVRGGFFASIRCRLGIEEYPGGRQYLRFRVWPAFCRQSAVIAAFPFALAAIAAMQHAWYPVAIFSVAALVFMLRALGDCAAATTCICETLRRYSEHLNAAPAPEADTASPPQSASTAVAVAEIGILRSPTPTVSVAVTEEYEREVLEEIMDGSAS